MDRQKEQKAIEQLKASEVRMKIKLDENAIMPTRAHEADAGLDLYSPCDIKLTGGFVMMSPVRMFSDYAQICIGAATIDTGVHIELPSNTVGMIKSKSGLNTNHGIICEGVIDEGYTGSIRVKLYNLSSENYTIHKGDKIAQLVILPIVKPELELVDELKATERGDNGFGSTGR